MNNRLLASLARKGGGKLLDLAVNRWLPAPAEPVASPAAPKKSAKAVLTGAVLSRLAMRSVPGAIVVGGGLLAKTLYDRRRAKRGGADAAKP